MIIGQNTEKKYEFVVRDEYNRSIYDIIEKIEFAFKFTTKGPVVNKYFCKNESSDIAYDSEHDVYLVPIGQAETKNIKDCVPVQVRVRFIDGTVESTDWQMWYVRPSLSLEDM